MFLPPPDIATLELLARLTAIVVKLAARDTVPPAVVLKNGGGSGVSYDLFSAQIDSMMDDHNDDISDLSDEILQGSNLTGTLLTGATFSGTTLVTGLINFSGTDSNIALGSNWLSSDGDDEGVFINSSGQVTISGDLSVSGVINTPSLLLSAPLSVLNGGTGQNSLSDLGNSIEYSRLSTTTDIDVSNINTLLDRAPSRWGRISATSLPNLYRTMAIKNSTSSPIYIVGFGSSVGVGATLPNPESEAPVARFTERLQSILDPGDIYNFQTENYSQNGSVIADFSTAWATMQSEGIAPKVVVLAYGMNDAAVGAYDSGQTFNGFTTFLTSAINTVRRSGADVIIMTTPHPSLVNYPNDYLPINADFLHNGTELTMDERFLRINQAMRSVAQATGATLIDVERYWMEAVAFQIDRTGNQSSAEYELFNSGQFNHPNLIGHQMSYWRGIDDFVLSLSEQGAQPGTTYSFGTTGTSNAFVTIGSYSSNTITPMLAIAGSKGATTSGLFTNQLSVMDTTSGGAAGVGGAITFEGDSGGGVITTYAAISARKANSTPTDYAGDLAFYSRPAGTSLTERMRILSSGNVGIGTTTPSARLTTIGTVRFAAFGAGTLQTDASGNLSVSSDERLKDIEGYFTVGLSAVNSLDPILYRWNSESGLETESVYAGFSAQNVQDFLPEAVGEDSRGFLTLSDRSILAAVVNAIKELWQALEANTTRDDEQERELQSLRARIEQLEVERGIVAPEPQVDDVESKSVNDDESIDEQSIDESEVQESTISELEILGEDIEEEDINESSVVSALPEAGESVVTVTE